jgi:hypothetical protein
LTDGNALTVDVSGLSGIIDPSAGIGGINGQIGPHLEFKGNNGIDVNVTDENCLVFDGAGLSGLVFTVSGQLQTNIDNSGGGGGGDGSGLNAINGELGPNIEIDGVNGVDVSTNNNTITIDAASLSGAVSCFTETFTDVTSTTINHGLGTSSVITNVFDSSDNQLHPDSLNIVDTNNVLLGFNRPQTGKIVIVACGGNESNFEECRRYALLVS